MMNYKKAKLINIPEQNKEVDPRSKTTAENENGNVRCTINAC